MKHWKKDRNYRKHTNTDGTVRYVITVDGTDVEVSAAVYRAYSQADRRERYCREREKGVLLSLERMDEDHVRLGNLADAHVESAEDTVLRQMLAEAALDALARLAPGEQLLIRAVVMEGVTEREYAARIGITQKGVNKRKNAALEKIRKFF